GSVELEWQSTASGPPHLGRAKHSDSRVADSTTEGCEPGAEPRSWPRVPAARETLHRQDLPGRYPRGCADALLRRDSEGEPRLGAGRAGVLDGSAALTSFCRTMHHETDSAVW